jgi:hypothetical protein
MFSDSAVQAQGEVRKNRIRGFYETGDAGATISRRQVAEWQKPANAMAIS